MEKKSYFFQMSVKKVESNDDNNNVIIKGFASTPDIDRYKDIVEPEAFKNALELYMKNPVVLYQHNADMPVGNVTSAVITDKGLQIVAEIKDEDTKAKVLDGRMRALSIGFIPLFTELQHSDGTAFNFEEDSIWDDDIVRVIKELDLVEISVVSTPANGNALFTVSKAIKKFFNEVTLKSLNMDKKHIDSPQPIGDEEEKLEDTPKTDDEQPQSDSPEEPENNDDEQEVDGGEEEKQTEQGDESPDNQEEPENVGEDPTPEAGEGEENGAEEGDAEEPETEGEPDNSDEDEPNEEEEKAVLVDAKTAEGLGVLMHTGLFEKAADGEKTAQLPDAVVGLMSKMAEKLTDQKKEIDDLKAKLDDTPEKKSLVLHGQYENQGGEVKNSGKMSPFLQKLFDNAVRAEVK